MRSVPWKLGLAFIEVASDKCDLIRLRLQPPQEYGMPEVFNILRALVSGSSRLVMSSEGNRIRLEATRQVNGSKPQNAMRTVSIGADKEEFCTALVEIYLELRSIPISD